MSSSPFRIAVIGGGIGGLFATLSLHQFCKEFGVEIDVYEQAAEYKEIGAGVGIGLNAAKLMHRLGFGPAVNDISGFRPEEDDGKSRWVSFRRYDNGEDIITVDGPSGQTTVVRQVSVHRAEFLDLLVGVIKERGAATLHTNKRLKSVKDSGTEVIISFEDGTTATANLVVGADGIHSKTRSQFATDKPMYSGRTAYRALIPINKLPSSWKTRTYTASWLGKGRQFLTFPVSRNTILNIVAFVATPEEKLGDLKESWTSVADKRELEADFKEFNDTVQTIIKLVPKTPSKWVLNDRRPLDQWVFLDGKVVLLGDAAHAMLPHQGAGAGQAIEDGYVLGHAIHDYLQASRSKSSTQDHLLERWAGVYQSVRLPRAQKVQVTSRDAGELYEMLSGDMADKSFEECIPIIREKMTNRLEWVWDEDLDAAYEGAARSLRNKL